VTHNHGDHIFGIPSLICDRSFRAKEKVLPLDIYGPNKLRAFLDGAISAARPTFRYSYRIHEIGPQGTDCELQMTSKGIKLASTTQFSVTAFPIRHTIPCFGYVILEKKRRPGMDKDKLKELGINGPMVGSLKRGGTLYFADGRVITPEDTRSTTLRNPRKIVILGDTSDASGIAAAAKGADILVHEATLLTGDSVARKRGHSTVKMAALFASKIRAKSLVLTHFGGRLRNKWDKDFDAMQPITPVLINILKEAKKYYGGPIYLAQDFLSLNLGFDEEKPIDYAINYTEGLDFIFGNEAEDFCEEDDYYEELE